MQVAKNIDLKNQGGEQADDGLLTTTLLLMVILVGAVAAVVALPIVAPSVSVSELDADQALYRHLSRASGFVAFGLVWVSMAFGLIIANKKARVWPEGPTAVDLHEYTSLVGLGFGLAHGLILLFAEYMGYGFVNAFVPFASGDSRALWMGLGQVGLYGLVLVGLTFLVRKQISERAWRYIHYGSYGVFVLILLHGVFSGSNTGLAWSGLIYWFAGASLAVLTVYRVLVLRTMKQTRNIP